ncbi:hypothetical protein [Paenibacillus tengchongensis]|uniref:hypothetical protein n=1 Tax=Paenibacillus tengchongensis TaxID=2608684 RepID=UPI00124F73E6|nr:hypothetical protein [Paenibacillus tengchongensis]
MGYCSGEWAIAVENGLVQWRMGWCSGELAVAVENWLVQGELAVWAEMADEGEQLRSPDK